MSLQIKLNKHRYTNEIGFVIVDVAHGENLVAKPLEFEVLPQFMCLKNDTGVLSQNSAQELMDELWHCGLRPSEGTGSAGQLSATQKHLEDMRTLVFEGKK